MNAIANIAPAPAAFHTSWTTRDASDHAPLLVEGTRWVNARSFVDQGTERNAGPRVVPLSDLRDVRLATTQTSSLCVAVLALGFDHGVETFAIDLDEAPTVIGQLYAARDAA